MVPATVFEPQARARHAHAGRAVAQPLRETFFVPYKVLRDASGRGRVEHDVRHAVLEGGGVARIGAVVDREHAHVARGRDARVLEDLVGRRVVRPREPGALLLLRWGARARAKWRAVVAAASSRRSPASSSDM